MLPIVLNTGTQSRGGGGYRRRNYRMPYKLKRKFKTYRSMARGGFKLRKFMKDFNTDAQKADRLNLLGATWDAATPQQRALRQATKWKGAGSYWGDLARRYIPEGSFSYLGRHLGNMSGIPGLGAAGAFAGHKLSRYVGFGPYGGDAGGNQIMSGSVDTPVTVNASDDLSGDVYISHREFVQNVNATGGSGNISAFNSVQFPLNAGLVTTFPWLSQIAANFSLYEFQGLIFEYRPTSGELGATGTNALGKVVMATNYDPDAPSFVNTIQMENYDYANSCKPSEHMLHGVETDTSQRVTDMLYIRTGTSTKDKVLTDLGTFTIATEGLPVTSGATAIIGELWVTYRIKLSRALLHGALLGTDVAQDQHFAVAAQPGTWTSNTTSNLATQTWQNQYYAPFVSPNIGFTALRKTSTINCAVYSDNSTQLRIEFPVNISYGIYKITWCISRSSSLNPLQFSTPTLLENCSFIQIPGVTTSVGIISQGNWNEIEAVTTVAPSNKAACMFCWIKVQAPGNLIAKITLNTVQTCDTNEYSLIEIREDSNAITQVVA